MKKKLLFVPALLLILNLQCCVTAKITSNKNVDYTKQPKKIFIMMNSAKEATSFSNDFLQNIQNKFKQKNVDTKTYLHDPLSFDTNDDINKKIDDYMPEALMIIQQKVIHSTNRMVDGGTFEITLVDGETKKNVWKSILEVYGQFGMEDAVNTSIEKLFRKLTEDKIIKG